jgi:hypothetical protein
MGLFTRIRATNLLLLLLLLFAFGLSATLTPMALVLLFPHTSPSHPPLFDDFFF